MADKLCPCGMTFGNSAMTTYYKIMFIKFQALHARRAQSSLTTSESH